MVLKYLLRKEFTQIRRNSFLPRLIIVFPIMVMCVMPWVMNMEVKNIVVDVVDNDRSTQSQRLVHEIEANNYFVFHGQQPTYAAALGNIEHSTSDAIVVIPQHYSRDLVLGRTPQVLVAANAVNGTKGSIGSAYLSQVVIAHASPSAASVQSQVSTLYLYNKQLDFKRFMIPALFAIVMMLMTGFLPTLNIVGEKEAGTIEQINVTPVSKWTFILAKLIPYWIIAFFVVTVCLLLSWGIYGIVPVGSIALVYLLAMLLALFFSSFGLIGHHAAGHLRHVVLRRDAHAALRPVHADTFHALRSLSDYLCQSGKLFYRGHADGLHPRRRHGKHLPPGTRPAWNRTFHERMGCAKL